MSDFEGRVAVVTGAGRGLGRAYAMEIARRGGRVVVNDLGCEKEGQGVTHGPADEVVAEIKTAGGEAIANYDSVSLSKGAQHIVDAALDQFGRIDVVINNAGNAVLGPFDELDIEAFESVVSVHLIGSAAVTRAAWPHLKAQKYGRVVMTVSTIGLFGTVNASPYCAAKAGVFGLMKALAQEGAPHNIKVNAISPGAKTRLSAGSFGDKAGWTWRPELVAPPVLHLASEQCDFNGIVLSAYAGKYGRIETVQSEGVQFDPKQEVLLEAWRERTADIISLESAKPLTSGLGDEIRKAGR